MKAKELLLAGVLLDQAADEFSNHGCNDWSFPDHWTEAEKVQFVKEYHDWNGDPEEFDPRFLRLGDSAVMRFLASKLVASYAP